MARLLCLCFTTLALPGCLFFGTTSEPRPADMPNPPDMTTDMVMVTDMIAPVDMPPAPDLPDTPPPVDMPEDLPPDTPGDVVDMGCSCQGELACDPQDLTCKCPEGFQDNDNNGTCESTCDDSDLCSEDQECDDSLGLLTCDCKDGLQDHDGDDVCTPSCEGLVCRPNEVCSDDDGTAVCMCEDGFQDHDRDGSCLEACEPGACFAPKVCEDSSGMIRCINPMCPPNEQDNDQDGVCEPSCTPNPCPGSKRCNDASGKVVCEALCAPGEQDKDGDGVCKPNCGRAPGCAMFWESCDDSSGTATCVPAPNGCPATQNMYANMGMTIPLQADVTIYQNGNINKPMLVTCLFNEPGFPTYLILPKPNVFEDHLTNRKITFTKLRLNPFHMIAEIDDATFATATPLPDATPPPPNVALNMLYGTVGACTGDLPGKGTIELPTDIVVLDTWQAQGICASGTTTDLGASQGLRPGQHFEITGQGDCGSYIPATLAQSRPNANCSGSTTPPMNPGNPKRFELHLSHEGR